MAKRTRRKIVRKIVRGVNRAIEAAGENRDAIIMILMSVIGVMIMAVIAGFVTGTPGLGVVAAIVFFILGIVLCVNEMRD